MTRPFRRLTAAALASATVLAFLGLSTGCALFGLASATLKANEDQKLVEVDAQYKHLAGHSVAVVVQVGLDVRYQHPEVESLIAGGVGLRIAQNVEGVTSVKNPADVKRWQYSTPQWESMAYGEMAEALGVDRVILIDVYEYRLNPPGNRYLWEGVCAATVGVIETDGIDSDSFVDSWNVTARFPTDEGITRQDASPARIQQGVLAEFTKKTSWLFYRHLEPKYPDRYRPELDA